MAKSVSLENTAIRGVCPKQAVMVHTTKAKRAYLHTDWYHQRGKDKQAKCQEVRIFSQSVAVKASHVLLDGAETMQTEWVTRQRSANIFKTSSRR